MIYINTTHHSDITYADLINLIISYKEERCIFKDPTLLQKLSKALRHMSTGEKENTSDLSMIPSFTEKALEYLESNLVFIIAITSLQKYYQWISYFPNLEKQCSLRFLNPPKSGSKHHRIPSVLGAPRKPDIMEA